MLHMVIQAYQLCESAQDDAQICSTRLAGTPLIRVPEVSCGQHKRRQDAHQCTHIAQDDLFIRPSVVSSVVN
jgi:hypothetical protein